MPLFRNKGKTRSARSQDLLYEVEMNATQDNIGVELKKMDNKKKTSSNEKGTKTKPKFLNKLCKFAKPTKQKKQEKKKYTNIDDVSIRKCKSSDSRQRSMKMAQFNELYNCASMDHGLNKYGLSKLNEKEECVGLDEVKCESREYEDNTYSRKHLRDCTEKRQEQTVFVDGSSNENKLDYVNYNNKVDQLYDASFPGAKDFNYEGKNLSLSRRSRSDNCNSFQRKRGLSLKKTRSSQMHQTAYSRAQELMALMEMNTEGLELNRQGLVLPSSK